MKQKEANSLQSFIYLYLADGIAWIEIDAWYRYFFYEK